MEYLEQKRIKFGEFDKNITKGKDVYFTATNIKDHTGILSENEEWRRVQNEEWRRVQNEEWRRVQKEEWRRVQNEEWRRVQNEEWRRVQNEEWRHVP